MDGQQTSPNMPSPAERPVGPTPEVGPIPAPTAGESLTGAGAGSAPQAAPAPQPKLSAADVVAAIAATPAAGVAPVVAGAGEAGDVDVIEPEWVDKAEAAVMQHLGDPYGEEEAIEELQEEYLEKRYGIHVAEPDGSDTKPKGT